MKKIRITESTLCRIVKESVKNVLSEIGDTSDGQRKLGALAQRYALRNPKYDARDRTSKEAYIDDYARKARGGDDEDINGVPQSPLYKDYAKGHIDYLNSHTDELLDQMRKRRFNSDF